MSTRSASISADDAQIPLIQSNTFVTKKSTQLRSASIGSNYFQKDSSTFFQKPDSAVVDESIEDSDDLEPATVTPNDIIDALGDLDLDVDFNEKNQNCDNGEKSDSKKNNNIYNNITNANHYQFYPYLPHPHHGSLTPNPPNLANFVAGVPLNTFAQTNTPSNTWNNTFIPNSAPPFAYGANKFDHEQSNSKHHDDNSKPLLSTKPFELPESDPENNNALDKAASGNNGKKVSIQNIHLNFQSPPPHPSNHPTFGGILENQLNFNIHQYNDQQDSKSAGSPDINDDEKSKDQHDPQDQHLQHLQHRHQSPFPHPQELLNQYPVLNDPSGNIIHPPPGNLWNQHPLMNSQLLHPGAMRTSFDNRLPNGPPPHFAPPQFSGPMMNVNDNGTINANASINNGQINSNQNIRYNGGNRRNNYDGMNVHRKMHHHNHHNGNRRKGDDASKYSNAKLEDFTGEIYNLCKDQHGCRFLQRQLDLGREIADGKSYENGLTNDIAATLIFNEIYLKIIELMTDPFGNYLIQKLFENVSNDQRLILVKNAAPDFIRIALDPHGTRALQKLVECISSEEEAKLIIDSLGPHIVSLSRDLNGNHVVQKCLQKLKPQENQFIFDAACLYCSEIATHRHGCCVLQRCLDHGNAQQRKQLSLKVAENATTLSLDPFGNYVVQYVLSRGDDESIQMILDHIKANVITLSLHKFGSNVIEKSLRISKLADDLINVLLIHDDKFIDLLNDAFGNYVLQTSLDVANPHDLQRLSKALQPLLPNIKNTPHGRRIMTKIQSVG
jgi:hypothetical protein